MTVISYAIATALYVMVEAPFASLTKHVILNRWSAY